MSFNYISGEPQRTTGFGLKECIMGSGSRPSPHQRLALLPSHTSILSSQDCSNCNSPNERPGFNLNFLLWYLIHHIFYVKKIQVSLWKS